MPVAAESNRRLTYSPHERLEAEGSMADDGLAVLLYCTCSRTMSHALPLSGAGHDSNTERALQPCGCRGEVRLQPLIGHAFRIGVDRKVLRQVL